MDFLSMLAVYLVLCTIFITCMLQADHPYLSQGPAARVRALILQTSTQCVQWCVPPPVQRGALALYQQLLCQRNCVFQLLYTLLLVAGHGVWLLDILQHLYLVEPDINHVFWPMLLLIVNCCFFLTCCVSDPGEIAKDNVQTYLGVYSFDDVMYKEGVECATCHLPKPARSKHCAVSDKCVYKFDHFCAWTNNSVGGLNQRYFVAFLISACVMCANGAAAALKAILNITHVYGLWKMKYIDEKGKPQPVTFQILAQSLFMQYPRLVFLAAALSVVTMVITGFTCYHLYLVATNQTTNERYKRHHLRRAGVSVPTTNLYDKGLLRNIREVIFPGTASAAAVPGNNSKHKKRR